MTGCTRLRLLFSICASALTLQVSGAVSAAASRAPAIGWDRSYTTEDLFLRYRGSLNLNKRELIFAAMGYAREGEGIVPRLWIWSIEKDSGRANRFAVQFLPESMKSGQAPLSVYDLECMSALPDGRIVAIVKTARGGHWLLRFDAQGRIANASEMHDQDMDAVLSQILPGGPRGFFVAGVTKAKAYVARLDDSGRIVWERHGGDAADVFMAVSQDRVILAANTVPTIDALRADGEIRIDAYDADGTQKATARVAGRRGRISGSEGGVAIVYDKGVSENLDIWLTEFDTELRSLRSSHVVKSEHGYAGFRIAASDDGGYVIAGAKERRPFAQRVESTGRVAWSFWSETLPIGLDVDVVASAQGVFMLYPRLEEDRTTVRVVALKE